MYGYHNLSLVIFRTAAGTQAADADPSQCNSPNMPTPPTLAKLPKNVNQQCDFDVLWDLECPKPV